MSKTLDLRDYPRGDDGRILTVESGRISTSRDSLSHDTSHDLELAPKHTRVKIWEFASLSGRAVSRAEIAKGLGYKKAPWLTVYIEQLVQERWLERTHTLRPNGAIMYFYTARRP